MAEIKRIRCGSENCYLIEKKGRAILIDTGRKGFEEKILNQCKKNRVELIILTHGHIEQVQNAAFLSKELKAPLAIHKSDVGILKDNFKDPVSYQGLLGMVVAEVAVKNFKDSVILDFTPDIFLKEGDRLDEYGIDGTVLELPGHTRGSVGVELEKRAVFVGDALMNLFYPGLPMIYCDREAMIKSAERISALGGRRIYFCHGNPAENRTWIRTDN
ncbi:MBL fold metallo-hydrolase [Lacrimispora sp.]|uniref:MBL fold metallo-hydrolase n=1 Tax=Lacrimispora sp. TaxID=2719234 RepID=UPI0029E1E789|nr:hydroxyacylglutathione hydrolase [Lacrimispora sp.]